MSAALKILVVVGSVRKGRSGRKVADWWLSQAREHGKEIEWDVLDLQEAALPLFAEAVPPLYHNYSPVQQSLADRIAKADGFVLVTGEYNHSIPGALKNFFDYVTAEWNHKVAAFVGYGVVGAIRAIEHEIQVMNNFGVACLHDHVHVNTVWEAFDESGALKPGYAHGDIGAQIKELVWWGKALKAAR